MNNMKTLHLTLKKKWFDMIESGEKKDEYRDFNPYWLKRLMTSYPNNIGGDYMDEHSCIAYLFNKYENVLFENGGHFGNVPKMTLKCNGIEIREGRPEWGAEPGKKYFVIKIGEKLDK